MSDIHHYVSNDDSYLRIVDNILENKEFNRLKEISHHGLSRYDHCLKVSYYSYKIAKTLKLDYKQAARGGLLHDFFLSNNEQTIKEKVISFTTHPKKAESRARELFDITEKEADIIASHMFPISTRVPKFIESWVVNAVDKSVAAYEFCKKFKKQIGYAMNLYLIFFINFIK